MESYCNWGHPRKDLTILDSSICNAYLSFLVGNMLSVFECNSFLGFTSISWWGNMELNPLVAAIVILKFESEMK
ncbi:unnamed protein product [Cuscuta campestris]|uniref:Uncharacterized protein n=1 Tax=Cuscuta campestris TaxID=132261 RepID=A0A484L6R3_9ASTE|nr:unnamed protein product [Cuscuta campestris]